MIDPSLRIGKEEEKEEEETRKKVRIGEILPPERRERR